jgi:hypothetical protein
MILKMRKGRRLKKYRRRAIGFYTDRQGRIRPITSTGRRRIWKTFSRNIIRTKSSITLKSSRPTLQIHTQIREEFLIRTMNLVLYQIPIIRELQSAYLVADAIYTNRDLIKKLYNNYQKGDLTGIAKRVENDTLHNALSSAQTNIVWATIKELIPRSYHDSSFDILSTIMNEITDEEIKYVRRFLEQTK